MSGARWRFDAIGTRWTIDTDAPLDVDTRAAVTGIIETFDREWSRFRSDSAVTALARGETTPAPADTAMMLDAYAELDAATGGAVNPLVGDALARRGYDATISLVDSGAAPAPTDWRGIVRHEAGSLRITPPAMLDVGALGKGRLVDLVHGALLTRVSGGIVIDAGGDLAVSGLTQRVALEHPYDTTRAIGVWSVTDAALCASAVNRRAWGDGLHHVLDARTGAPVRQYAATWAVAPDAMTADAVATALFFDGGPELAADWGAEWVRMRTDGSVEWSPRSEAELFL